VAGDILTIPGTKTNAALRRVPIHSAIQGLVVRLVADAQGKERWLIRSTAENQYADRSPPLGQRFGRLKATMGFGPAYVFHSIRKAVATLLEDAGCPEGVAADILGHEKNTITYGLYSGGASLETKRHWLEKAVVYPSGAPAIEVVKAVSKGRRTRKAT
jgi:integrase